MLIEAREEVNIVAEHAVVTCQDVGEDLFVGVTDVRVAIRIIDGSGDVEGTRHCRDSYPREQGPCRTTLKGHGSGTKKASG